MDNYHHNINSFSLLLSIEPKYFFSLTPGKDKSCLLKLLTESILCGLSPAARSHQYGGGIASEKEYLCILTIKGTKELLYPILFVNVIQPPWLSNELMDGSF